MRWALPMDDIRLTRSLLRAARRAVEFPDVRSESAGESMSRVRLMEEGLPRTELQHEIFGPDGWPVPPCGCDLR